MAASGMVAVDVKRSSGETGSLTAETQVRFCLSLSVSGTEGTRLTNSMISPPFCHTWDHVTLVSLEWS